MKIASILSSVAIAGLMVLGCGSHKVDRGPVDPPTKLSFREDGTFKILQVTDLHARYDTIVTEHPFKVLNRILDIEEPDLVIMTGDVTREDSPEELWKKITGFFSSRGIPFAVAFGNHDSEKNLPRNEVYDIVTHLKGSLNTPKAESEDVLPGYTNQVIPIYASADSDQKAYILYLLDSHRGEPIDQKQVDWYKAQSAELTTENGGEPYRAIAFFHVPVAQFDTASTVAGAKMVGYKLEGDYGSPSGIFDAFRECGDVKAIFCGHNHDNDYVTFYKGLALGYGRNCAPNITYHNLCVGARAIVLKKDAPDFETWLRTETYRVVNKCNIPYTFTTDDPQYQFKK